MEQLNNETNGMVTWKKVFGVIGGINFIVAYGNNVKLLLYV